MKRVPPWVGQLAGWSALCWLGLGWPVVGWVGESNPTTAWSLFLPPQIWLYPMIITLPVTLFLARPLFLSQIICAALFIFWGTGFAWNLAADLKNQAPDSSSLTLYTHNRGQSTCKAGTDFLDRMNPDIILLQDSKHRFSEHKALFPGYPHGSSLVEFTILSRHPVLETQLIHRTVRDLPFPVAARSVVDFHGTQIAVYNVHLPTPRETLEWMNRGALVPGVLGIPGTTWADTRKQLERYWAERLEMARALNRKIADDSLPVIVAGDFNSPARGQIYEALAENRRDAHQKGGKGWGFTFPGHTRNPLAMSRSWLRLDRIHCGEEWEVVATETESGTHSQHCAVVTKLKLIPSNAGKP